MEIHSTAMYRTHLPPINVHRSGTRREAAHQPEILQKSGAAQHLYPWTTEATEFLLDKIRAR